MTIHSKIYIFAYIIYLFVFSGNANSQTTAKKFNFINAKNGISNVAVTTINQDEYGLIWIGTSAGLHKYDGIEYKSYKYNINDSTSISSNIVHCSFIDSKKRLWFGTSEGISYYKKELDHFKRINIFDSLDPEKRNLPVLSISEDNSGNIFIGTLDNGLYILDSENFQVSPISNFDNEIIKIYCIEKDWNGKVYVGTDKGLKVYDEKNKNLKNAVFYSQTGIKTITEPVESMLIDSIESNLWIGTWTSGLIKIQFKNDFETDLIRFPITNKRVMSLLQLPDSTLLCGTENDGLIHINNDGTRLRSYLADKTNDKSIQSNSIWSMLLDNKNRIWIGYYNSGIGVYDELYDKFNHFESLSNNVNSLHSNSVTGITQDASGKYWICMDGGGIDIYNPENKKFIHINNDNSNLKGLSSLDIQTVFTDSKQNIWIGSWSNGFFLLKKGTNKFINFNKENNSDFLKSNSIISFSEDSNNTVWIGTFYEGLFSYNLDSEEFTKHNGAEFEKHGIPNETVRKVFVDSNDNIWVGTPIGLFKIIRNDDDSFKVLPIMNRMFRDEQNRANSNHIYSIYESSDGNIWIGTRGAGLCKYDVDKDEFIWNNLTYNHDAENVNAIIESLDGNIWYSGNSGISMLNTKTNKVNKYNINDGLLSNDFNYNSVFRDNNGYLYFGSYKGVDFFDPSNIRINNSEPILYLTDFKLFNEKVSPNQEGSPLTKVLAETDHITLNYDESVFSIEYNGINYTRPEKNQYAYYLEGFQKSWNYVGNSRSATYTNLNHGDYTFKLKSANNDGVWNTEPLNLKITILPPWWKTNWALILYLTVFILGLYLLNKLTKIRIIEKQEFNNEKEKRLQKEELNESKLRFFTNISHEFRTPLTLILNPLEDIIKTENLNLPVKIQEKHQIIYKNASRLSRLIDELMDFRKLELNKVRIKVQNLELISFVKDIGSFFNEEALSKKIYLNIDSNDSELNVWADHGMLEKIIFNILSNAFKVTPEGGSIVVYALKKPRLEILPLVNKNTPISVFEISIRDTGPGLKQDQIDKIFERFYQVDKLNNSYIGGTGIGLEVVQSFIELHKGKIEVKSKVDSGTTFKITLPLGREHLLKEQIISIDPIDSALKKDRFILPKIEKDDVEFDNKDQNEALTLLIVEDNTELLNYLKMELSKDYKVLTANNGIKGLEQARKGMPDVIITDVVMPEMNGFEFCINVKKDLRISHTPILMLTTKTMTDDWIEGIDSGADAYMSKPFNLRILKSRLTQLTTNRQLLFNKYFSKISEIPENLNSTSLDKEFIQKVLDYINDNIGNPELSVDSMASQLNLSRSQFYRKIKSLTGTSANGFLRKIRLQRAKLILEKGNANISEVCYHVGFSTPSYFTRCFKSEFGVLPTEINK